MMLLLDNNRSPGLCDLLARDGWDVVHVRALGLQASIDNDMATPSRCSAARQSASAVGGITDQTIRSNRASVYGQTSRSIAPTAAPRLRATSQLKDDLINGDELLELHHGTTLRAANRIVDVGWEALDLPAVIDRVAAEHGVRSTAVRDLLAEWYRFVVVADGRGTNASFSPNVQKVAHSWAQRAPEAEWEVLWAVYYLLHPDTSPEQSGWASDVAGHAWVWNRMRREPLAVLSYETNYPELALLDARLGPGRAVLGSRRDVRARWANVTEISFDLPFRPDPARLNVTPIARHLPWDVYAHELGLAPEEFERRADRGDFGVPVSDGLVLDSIPFVPTPWWDSATAPLIAPPDT